MKNSLARLLARLAQGRSETTPGFRMSRPSSRNACSLENLESRTMLTVSPTTAPIVAVLDTGFNLLTDGDYLLHQWTNPNETTTNVGDNDLNGFPNDINGWNFINNNNDLSDLDTNNFHGATMVDSVVNAAQEAGASNFQIMAIVAISGFPAVTTSVSGTPTITTHGSAGLTNAGNGLGIPASISTLVSAIDYVVKEKTIYKQNVVAMTIPIGGFNSNAPSADPSLNMLKSAIDWANSNGIATVIGAGNVDSNNDAVPSYPANFKDSLLISVAGGDDTTGDLEGNFGHTTVQLAAPNLLLTDLPNGQVQGTIVQSVGSEFAAGAVAGVIAAEASLNPTSSTANIVNAIYKGVEPNSTLTDTTITGGFLDPTNPLTIQKIGSFVNNHPPVGVIESAGVNGVSGYAYDPDNTANPADVFVYIDGVYANAASANLAHSGLSVSGNHGFLVSYPTLTPGSHVVTLKVTDYPTNVPQTVATQTVNITASVFNITLNGNPVTLNQSVSFGQVYQGSTVNAIFSVTNSGNQTLGIGAINLPAGYTLVKDIARQLNPGQTDTFVIGLNATTSGTFNGQASFTTSDPNFPTYTLRLSAAVGTSYVANLYQTLLNRSPDAAGLAYWTQQLVSRSLSATQVAAAIINSNEYHSKLVQSLYTSILRRNADSAGLAYWTAALDHGGTQESIRNAFLTSDEYFALQGFSNTNLIQGYYETLLLRPADSQGLSAYANALATGTSRATIVHSITYSTEGLAATVQRLFRTYLGRNSDPAGVIYWSAQLAAGVPELTVAANLLGSTEFFIRS